MGDIWWGIFSVAEKYTLLVQTNPVDQFEKNCEYILVVGSKSGGGRSDYNNAKVGRILENLGESRCITLHRSRHRNWWRRGTRRDHNSRFKIVSKDN